jgi:5-methylcytosine-specific restriction enzyme subunit McrC
MIDKGIQIKNIFYMLAYAFRSLKKVYFNRVDLENFCEVDDLLAEILHIGISYQLKQGLKRDYVIENEDLLTIKGKINLNNTINNLIKNKRAINCDFDNFDENIEVNQILKSTIKKLLSCETVSKERKIKLKRLLPYFESVVEINLKNVVWEKINFDSNNQNYVLLMNICKIVTNSLIMTENNGNNKHTIFTDDQLNLVFQNFVLNYYKEYAKKKSLCDITIKSKNIDRAINKDEFYEGIEYLPKLQTDITIENRSKTLIIDTKFYQKTLGEHFDKLKYHRDNINQIHEYVNQYGFTNKNKEVCGMLLYAKTNETTHPNMTDVEMGHKFYIRTMDLNVSPFEALSSQLDRLFEEVFATK